MGWSPPPLGIMGGEPPSFEISGSASADLHTQIFKTVTFVDSDRKDYTDKLTSNLNGILKYFHFIFFVKRPAVNK